MVLTHEQRTTLLELTYQGVAVTAAVDSQGSFRPVGELGLKLSAAALSDSFPAVTTVVVACTQALDETGLEALPHGPLARDGRPAIYRDRSHDLHIIRAVSLEDAIDLLARDSRLRWGPVLPPDYRSALSHYGNLDGRQELIDEVVRWLLSESRGDYLLLTAGPGYGKTTLLLHLWRHASLLGLPEPAAIHFIRRGQGNWDEPRFILNVLIAQLRQRYRLPLREPWREGEETVAFHRTLEEVSRLAAVSRPVVIMVDGLDEGFGPTGRFAGTALPGVFPAKLWPGIKMILTSRPGEHVNWLADAQLCRTINLRMDSPENQQAILAYVTQQNETRSLGLDPAFCQRLAEAAQGCFLTAVRYLLDPEQLRKWRVDPASLPPGLEGWLEIQWQQLKEARSGVQQARDCLKAVLGLLVAAREPVSQEDLVQFLKVTGKERYQIAGATLDKVRRHLEEVLERVGEYFEPLDLAKGPAAVYRFFNTSFREFLARKLGESCLGDCHTVFARGWKRWETFREGPVRTYALSHALSHWREAGDWRRLARAFADGGYIEERSRRFGFAGVYEEALAAARDRRCPEPWRQVWQEWERFLRFRIDRLERFPAAYAQEVVNEFLGEAAGPTDNLLLRSWGEKALHKLRTRCLLQKDSGSAALSGLGHSGPVLCVAWSPEGNYLASASRDGTVKVFEATSGQLLVTCQGHTDWVLGVAWSSEGSRLASASRDGTVKVFEATSGRLLATCQGHTSEVRCVVWSPKGNYLASASRDRTVRLWSLRGQAASCLSVLFFDRPVLLVSFDSTGAHLVVVTEDGRSFRYKTLAPTNDSPERPQ